MSQSAEECIMEAIGKFLLELYHQQVISPRNNWSVSKHDLENKFKEFMCMQENLYLLDIIDTSLCLGTLLRRTNYVWNTTSKSNDYRIRHSSLFLYRNQKLEEYDGKHRKTIQDKKLEMQSETYQINEKSLNLKTESANNEIIKSRPLMHKEMTLEDLTALSMLASMSFSDVRVFKLSYTNCKQKSNLLSLTIETRHPNFIIDEIVLLHAEAMIFKRMPLDVSTTNNKLTLLVDFQSLSMLLEYSVLIVFHDEINKDMQIVEKHHSSFQCTEEVPLKIKVKTKNMYEHLSNKRTFKSQVKLLKYTPTAITRSPLEQELFEEQLCRISQEFSDYISCGKLLTQQNICQVMKILLQVEDIDTLRDYSKLVQRKIKLRKHSDEYAFDFDNSDCVYNENLLTSCNKILIIPESDVTKTLDENRLIDLLVEDEFKNSKNMPTILWGELQYVSMEYLTFTCKEKISENEFYMIIFRPSRLRLCYQYRALELLATMPARYINRCLFPKFSKRTPNLPDISLVLQNKRISDNPQQLHAVHNIIDDQIKNAPYIIFGPPGTGKTTTVVESILQLYLRRPNAKILVSAGSNSACDEIALRLCTVISKLKDQRRALVRVYSQSYEKCLKNINELVLEFSNLYTKHFYPNIELLHEYRIVVCTLSTVGKLALGNFGKTNNKAPTSVYTHVFIDEIAASSEPEALIGIVCTLSAQANLIISGDHKQLGAVIRSQRAKILGLDISLMERLLERDCYAVDEQGNYDRNFQIRLCRNYRSHPKIVNLYNGLYYNNEMKAMVANDANFLCVKWHRSPNPNYPIIFYSIRGNSQGNFNRRELDVVMDYVKDLMYFGVNGQEIQEEDIGIISPYKKQYELIQKELHLRQWYRIETGSAEIFRGKEKSIIIVSFVRSFTETLGFLNDPKRLSVILSRAKSLLILIGNRETLSLNADLKYVIEECRKNNTLETGKIPRRNDASNEPIQKHRSATVNLKQQQRKFNQKPTSTHRQKLCSANPDISTYPSRNSTQSSIQVLNHEQNMNTGTIPQRQVEPKPKSKSKTKCFFCCIIA